MIYVMVTKQSKKPWDMYNSVLNIPASEYICGISDWHKKTCIPYFEYKLWFLFIFVVTLSSFYSGMAFIIFCRHTIKRAKRTFSRQKC